MKEGQAHLLKWMAVSLLAGAIGGSWTFAAESSMRPANHPPGFVKPEPDAVVRLWPGDAPGLVPGGRPESVVNERYRDVSMPQLYAFLAKKNKANGTSLIICAGGGYVHLAWCVHVENVVKLLNDQGIAVFGLKYRTQYGKNNVIEDALADAKRAVRIVRSRAQQWGIDPQRIGIQGYSAGGNVCLNLACRFDGGDPKSPDPIERLSSRPDFTVMMCPWPFTQKIDDFVLRNDSPPTFIANAKDDQTVPIAFVMAVHEKFKSAGVDDEIFVPETGGHGAFHVGMVEGPGVQWPDLLIQWLKKIKMLN